MRASDNFRSTVSGGLPATGELSVLYIDAKMTMTTTSLTSESGEWRRRRDDLRWRAAAAGRLVRRVHGQRTRSLCSQIVNAERSKLIKLTKRY